MLCDVGDDVGATMQVRSVPFGRRGRSTTHVLTSFDVSQTQGDLKSHVHISLYTQICLPFTFLWHPDPDTSHDARTRP